MIYKIIYVDDKLRDFYENADEIIISWWAIPEFDIDIIREIDNLVDNHLDAKIYFENLNEETEKQTRLMWPEIVVLK
jgi:hypothetical protein